jgi:predicted nucleic acid-binding protein
MITIDSNVFLYLLDDAAPAKQVIAARVISAASERDVPVALQVIGEVQSVAIRKMKIPPFVAAQYARNILTTFNSLGAASADADVALGQLASGRLSYWDALLIACARRHGCTALLTEDMQDGANVLGVEICNPFGAGGLSPRAAALLAG